MRRIRSALLPRTGNLTAEPGKTYQYDAENRLTAINGGAVATYKYNAAGQRVQKIIGNTTYTYYYDLAGNVVAEWYGTPGGYNGWGKGYVYLGGQLVAQYADSTTYFVHKDHLGSTRLLTKLDQSVQETLDFLPYGEQLNSTSTTSHKFTGKERDAESNLDFFIARYYSSQYGRFLSPDEFTGGPVDAFSANDPLPPGPLPYADITNPLSLNKYSYVLNVPLRYLDPNGHDFKDFLLGVVNAIGSNGSGGAGRQESYNPDHAAGQKVGDAVSVVIGVAEIVVGASTSSGGVVASGTGVGLVAGVPAVAAGNALASHGVVTAVAGIINLSKGVPNPYGSKGAPDHQQTAAEEARKLGPTGQREVSIKTKGDEKGSRRADAANVDPTSKQVSNPVQVYRPTKTGLIPARERRAARDIESATGQKPKMVPGRPLKKPDDN